MAPGPGGSLYVSIPRPGGSVLLVLLDSTGRPEPGWPVTLPGAPSCGLLPVDDGSIRVLCLADDLNQDLNSGVRAFAFDSKGGLLAGWPVDLHGLFTGRVVGDELTVFGLQWLTDVVEEGKVSHEGWLMTVAADGSLRSGVRVPMVETCFCGEAWAVGPDGIAYGVVYLSGWAKESAEVSLITALDLFGVRAGWPVKMDGIASGPTFGPGGRIVVTVGSFARRTSRVLVFDRDGKAASATSAELPIATAEFQPGLDVDCIAGSPVAPIVAGDGTIFVFSEIDTAVYALDRSLAIMHGWPFEPATPVIRPDPHRGEDGISCPSLGVPAVGPEGVLYLPLQTRDATVGGSMVAVGSDGRVRPGWPVELRRPGAEFWSVVVGSDGTAYALTIEPETGDRSSATILAIAQDGAVRYRATVVEP